MFEDIFTRTYYGNTILEWAIALGIVILSAMLAKTIYFFIGKTVKRMTKNTRTEFDDILIDKFEEPIVFALLLGGIWYAFLTLNLSDGARDFVHKSFYFLIVLDAAWFVTRFLDAIIIQYVRPFVDETETKLDDQLLPLLRKTLKASIWIIAVLVALNNAGYNVGAILASLGIGGLAFALAAKDTVANLFGSLTIFLDKPFEVKDRVIVQGYDGYVEEVGLRSTRIRTLNGRMVTLANSEVANSSIENVSSEPNRKITVDLGLTYDTSPERMERAMEILREIVLSNEELEADVVTAFTAFNDSALNIRLIYYIKKGHSVFGNQTKVNLEILRRFNAEGLEFAFPTQTLYLEKSAEA